MLLSILTSSICPSRRISFLSSPTITATVSAPNSFHIVNQSSISMLSSITSSTSPHKRITFSSSFIATVFAPNSFQRKSTINKYVVHHNLYYQTSHKNYLSQSQPLSLLLISSILSVSHQ